MGPEYDGLRQGVSVVNTTHASAGTLIRINSGKPLPNSVGDKMDHSIEPNLYGNVKMFNDYTKYDDIVGRFNPKSYLDDPGTQQYPIVMHDLEVRQLHLTDGVIEPLTIKGAMSVGTEIPFLAHGVKGALMAGNIEPEDGVDLINQYKEYMSGSIFLEPFTDAQESAMLSYPVAGRAKIFFLANVRDRDAIVLTGSNGNVLKFEFDSGNNVIEIDNDGNHKGIVRVDVHSTFWTPVKATIRFETAGNASSSFLGISAARVTTNGQYSVLLIQHSVGKAGNTPIQTMGQETSGSLIYDADGDAKVFILAKSDQNVSGSGFYGGKDQFTLSAPGYTSDFVRGIVKFDDSYSADPRSINVISGAIRDEGLISHNQKSAGAGFTYGNNDKGTDSLAFGDLSRS